MRNSSKVLRETYQSKTINEPRKKTSTQASVKKFCLRAGFKFNLCFWWQNWLGHFWQTWLKMWKRIFFFLLMWKKLAKFTCLYRQERMYIDTGKKINFSCGDEIWTWRIMHGSIWPVTNPPGQPSGQVQPFGPWVRGWGKLKISFLWFCEVRVISRAVYTMAADLKTTYFKEKGRNLSESGWIGITYQN